MFGKPFPERSHGARMMGMLSPLESAPPGNVPADVCRNTGVLSPNKLMSEKVPPEPLPE